MSLKALFHPTLSECSKPGIFSNTSHLHGDRLKHLPLVLNNMPCLSLRDPPINRVLKRISRKQKKIIHLLENRDESSLYQALFSALS